MALREEYEKIGHILFRFRSYIPLILAPFLIAYLFINRETLDTFINDYTLIIISLAVCFIGLTIRAITIGYAHPNTSGRNVNQQIADHINITGIYSTVRHPLYLGNFLIWLGISLRFKSLFVSFIMLFFFWIYYEKIMYTEEEFLRANFGDSFIKWAAKTPLLIPNPFLWTRPHNSFSFKRILRKEPDSVYAPIVMLFFIDISAGFFYHHILCVSKLWIIIISISTLLYLTLKIIKKRTRWLVETP